MRKLRRLRALRSTLRAVATILAIAVTATCVGQSGHEQTSFYEFGTVVGIGHGRVEVQTFDPQTRHFAQHSFILTRESKAEVVRPGDTVQVIFGVTGAGAANGPELTLFRMFALREGFPKPASAAGALPASPNTVPPAAAAAASPRSKPVPAPIVRGAATVRPPNPVSLAGKNSPHLVAPVAVPPIAAPRVPTPVVLGVAHEAPTAECRQSDTNWGTEPLSIAVLDFRYPTEREEAHDIGKTGGGSGTALADIIFERLKKLPEFTVDRGDRRRLDRADIAGAAKIGRELGVDAVIEGTFSPADDPAMGYELRAGLVDTCTGQVLMKLASEVCPPTASTSADGSPPKAPVCTKFTVTAKQAEEPDANVGAFAPAIGALLYPLEHNAGPLDQSGSAGLVTGTTKDQVIVRLQPGATVKVGDQVAIHAQRLAKNPTTYTLQALKGQEIGRMTIRSVQGTMAVGSYSGDIFPKAGDTAELVTE